MKRIYFTALFSMFILSLTLFSCTGKVDIEDLDKREDGRYYKVGEDKPYTGLAYSTQVKSEWEYRTGRQIRATGFYKNGNKRHETLNGSHNTTQFYDPDGNPISNEVYRENYTRYE